MLRAPPRSTPFPYTPLFRSPLVLVARHAHDQAVERVADANLAGEAGVWLHLLGGVEHAFLHRGGLAPLLPPRLVHLDVAGGIGRGHVLTPVTPISRIPSSSL